jgi:hypothetical protein
LFRAKLRTLVCKPPVNCSVTHKPLDNKNNGTCYDCYQFVIKRLIEIAETRINTGFFKQLDLFKFDDYIAKRPMNENGSNEGGYEKSDLKKWIENDLFKMFPKALRKHMTGLTIPTLGEICGWGDNWDKEHIEPDSNEQLPLMKQRRNRVAYYNNECSSGWLRNAMKKEFSSAYFADVGSYGITNYDGASNSFGVRPEFWLVR